MDFLVIPAMLIGLASAVLTELLKLIPALSETDERKRFLALIVSFAIGTVYYVTQITIAFTLEGIGLFLLGSLSATFVIYKAIVQPIENVASAFAKAIKHK